MQVNSAADRWQDDRTSTVGWPRWLTIAALVLLGVRLALALFAAFSPGDTGRHSDTGAEQPAVAPASGKLHLIEIVASGGPTSQALERTFAKNLAVRNLLRDNFSVQRLEFIPDDKNSAAAAVFKKYRVYSVPALIVQLPTGQYVSSQGGHDSSQLTYLFLQTALKQQLFTRGKQAFINANFAEASRLFRQYRQAGGKNYPDAHLALLYGALCLLIEGRDSEARSLLSQNTRTDARGTYTAGLYLQGEISEEKFLERNVRWNVSSKKMVIGLKHLADHDPQGAQVNLSWVTQHADPDSNEFAIAEGILAHRLSVPALSH